MDLYPVTKRSDLLRSINNRMAFNNRIKIKSLIEGGKTGEDVTLMGWVRTKRSNKNVSFIALNDGSTLHNYQIVADTRTIPPEALK